MEKYQQILRKFTGNELHLSRFGSDKTCHRKKLKCCLKYQYFSVKLSRKKP